MTSAHGSLLLLLLQTNFLWYCRCDIVFPPQLTQPYSFLLFHQGKKKKQIYIKDNKDSSDGLTVKTLRRLKCCFFVECNKPGKCCRLKHKREGDVEGFVSTAVYSRCENGVRCFFWGWLDVVSCHDNSLDLASLF